ncbi:MAG: domain containing protein [Bradyrhizobium sp.]|nr:domain containing protein [Bradyrhizobium sp.]
MTSDLILAVAFLALPLILLFTATGCVGEDALNAKYAEGSEAAKTADASAAADAAEAARQEQLYDKSIEKEPLLVAYWRFAEQQGDTTLLDSAPGAKHSGEYKHTNGISLGQKGVLALTEDANDKAAAFLGTQGFADVPYSALLNPPEITVECWILPDGAGAGPQVILGSYEADASGALLSGYLLDLVREIPAGAATPVTKVRARFGGGGSLVGDLGPGLQREGWRHVVFTYVRSAPSSSKLYVNADGGTPADEKDGQVYTVLGSSTVPLRFGAGQGAAGVATEFYLGRIDEVAIYNGPLTNKQVQTHYLKSF